MASQFYTTDKTWRTTTHMALITVKTHLAEKERKRTKQKSTMLLRWRHTVLQECRVSRLYMSVCVWHSLDSLGTWVLLCLRNLTFLTLCKATCCRAQQSWLCASSNNSNFLSPQGNLASATFLNSFEQPSGLMLLRDLLISSSYEASKVWTSFHTILYSFEEHWGMNYTRTLVDDL